MTSAKELPAVDTDPRLVEPPVRFSESQLWEIQRNYFQTMGIKAWREEVPFYISSNAFIGQRYALLVLNFIKDWHLLHPRSHTPFYIMETGSGTGKFSYFFLKSLKELLASYNMADQPFCYIMTDLIEKNLEFCEKNPSFAPFIDQGILDFSCFNVETDKDIYLRKQKKNYSELHVKTPLIVIANYTLDCITQDAVDIKFGKMEAVKLGLRSRYKHFDVEKSEHLNDLTLTYEKAEINPKTHYENPYLNEILEEYQESFESLQQITSIVMPMGGFTFFDNLSALTHKKFFAIVGDKGISLLEKLPLIKPENRVSYDGCYAFSVNFHALGRYIEKCGGDYLATHNSNDFKVCLYSVGFNFEELKDTKACFKTVIENTGPDEYCYTYDEYLTSSHRFSVRGLLSFLRFSQWDPDAYSAIHNRLLELIPATTPYMLNEITQDLNKVKDKVYRMNIGDDVYNLLGIFYLSQDLDDKALELFHESIAIFGEKSAPHNNAAVIYEKKKNMSKALFHYQKSYEMDKQNSFARRKSYQLLGKPTFALIEPVVKGIVVLALIMAAFYYFQQ